MKIQSRTTINEPQHSLLISIFYHLFPGIIFIIYYIIFTPIFRNVCFPSFFSLLIGAIFIILPFELGTILFQGKKLTGKLSLEKAILYREKITTWQYIIFALPLVVWGILIGATIAAPLDDFFIKHFFNWLPDWFFVQEMGQNLSNYSKPALIITLTTGFFINGIFGPIIEELYFRGFLLPRISRFKGWAPLINTVLFSLYHFFTPWQNVMRILGFGPMIYAVWWRKNIYLGMIVHCTFNIIGTTSMIVFIFSNI